MKSQTESKPLRNGVQRARGGRRPGAGRKPGALTLLKRELIKDRGEQAEYALDLYISVMRDEEKTTPLRLGAATVVMDRIWGKPSESMTFRGVVASDDLAKLDPEQRRARIAELLELRERSRAAAPAPDGVPGASEA